MAKILQINNLSKRYRIGGQRAPYLSLRESLLRLPKRKKQEHFWALRDISFEVEEGDSVGIIGKNGAGKSTLLKILSRITPPTSGIIKARGRVASLLEVGTGFHPELSGRENIFLNGSILGLQRAEINRKFDEIVDFSGVERFLDTPLKHYSSGMQLRLAFSVAAHLEPEILVIDEVLAVGDAEFQKKCLGKMDEVSKSGRTILFVSHNLTAVENLCNKAILLENGKKTREGTTSEIINQYLITKKNSKGEIVNLHDRKGSGGIQLKEIKIFNGEKNMEGFLRSGEKGIIRFCFANKKKTKEGKIELIVGIDNRMNERVALFRTDLQGKYFNLNSTSDFDFDLVIPKVPFVPGSYSLSFQLQINGEVADWIKDVYTFQVDGGDFFRSGKSFPVGKVFVDHDFSLRTSI